jgi:hypothetical protein
MAVAFFGNVQIKSLLAADLAIIVFWNVCKNARNSDCNVSWMYLCEEVLDDCVLVRMKVDNPAIHDITLKRVFQTLIICFVWITHVCPSPKLDIVEKLTCKLNAFSIKVLQSLDACHCDLSSQTEPDQCDCASLEILGLKQKECKHGSGESCLVLSEDELPVTCDVDVACVQKLLHGRHLLSVL